MEKLIRKHPWNGNCFDGSSNEIKDGCVVFVPHDPRNFGKTDDKGEHEKSKAIYGYLGWLFTSYLDMSADSHFASKFDGDPKDPYAKRYKELMKAHPMQAQMNENKIFLPFIPGEIYEVQEGDTIENLALNLFGKAGDEEKNEVIRLVKKQTPTSRKRNPFVLHAGDKFIIPDPERLERKQEVFKKVEDSEELKRVLELKDKGVFDEAVKRVQVQNGSRGTVVKPEDVMAVILDELTQIAWYEFKNYGSSIGIAQMNRDTAKTLLEKGYVKLSAEEKIEFGDDEEKKEEFVEKWLRDETKAPILAAAQLQRTYEWWSCPECRGTEGKNDNKFYPTRDIRPLSSNTRE